MLRSASFGHFRLLILHLEFAGGKALAHLLCNRHFISWLLVHGRDALLHVSVIVFDRYQRFMMSALFHANSLSKLLVGLLQLLKFLHVYHFLGCRVLLCKDIFEE